CLPDPPVCRSVFSSSVTETRITVCWKGPRLFTGCSRNQHDLVIEVFKRRGVPRRFHAKRRSRYHCHRRRRGRAEGGARCPPKRDAGAVVREKPKTKGGD